MVSSGTNITGGASRKPALFTPPPHHTNAHTQTHTHTNTRTGLLMCRPPDGCVGANTQTEQVFLEEHAVLTLTQEQGATHSQTRTQEQGATHSQTWRLCQSSLCREGAQPAQHRQAGRQTYVHI